MRDPLEEDLDTSDDDEDDNGSGLDFAAEAKKEERKRKRKKSSKETAGGPSMFGDIDTIDDISTGDSDMGFFEKGKKRSIGDFDIGSSDDDIEDESSEKGKNKSEQEKKNNNKLFIDPTALLPGAKVLIFIY